MKIKYIIIGIMMALVLCITPVAAVSADDFEIDVEMNKDGMSGTYTYFNVNNQSEEYIKIITDGTEVLNSIVTFKPANIPDAPTMVVKTTRALIFLHPYTYIYLPMSVDEWEIKYYSEKYDYTNPYLQPDDKYLKNAGVVNLNEYFGKDVKVGLYLELSWDQYINSMCRPLHSWTIPEV